jgi:anti-sigma factor ChrR (cupin superfamily)
MVAETPDYAPHSALSPMASRYVDVDRLAWRDTGCPGLDWKILFQDKERGLMTTLVRWAPGAELDLHEHMDIEQSYILEGRLVDEEGECLAGDFVWRPIGNTHRARAPEGALLIAIFQRPNVFLEGPFAGQALE